MAHAAPVRTKIPAKIPQPAGAGASWPAWPKARRAARSRVLASGAGRPATRGGGDPVIELEYGITVYPAREGRDRWRAVWYENGKRRQCEAVFPRSGWPPGWRPSPSGWPPARRTWNGPAPT